MSSSCRAHIEKTSPGQSEAHPPHALIPCLNFHLSFRDGGHLLTWVGACSSCCSCCYDVVHGVAVAPRLLVPGIQWLRCPGVMRKQLRIEAAGVGLAGRGAVRIRLVRFGRKKLPYYRIIIANSRSRRDGNFLKMVGHYNPMLDKNGEKDIQVNGERIKYWLSVGAQPSDTVRNTLYKQGVMTPLNSPEPAPAAEA